MNQSLNILRKDASQLRLQILGATAVLVLFTAIEPLTWVQMDASMPILGSRSGVLGVLVLANWAILIIRLVQSERMVGLNQFWTTRPYEWKKLIEAKGLFLLLFIYLPLVLSQLYLLWRAHLPIVENIPLLLFNLFLFSTIFVLPFVCFAALTASFAQAMLVLLGTALLWVLVNSFDAPRFKELTPRSLGFVQYAILAAVLTAALLHQYWRRGTLRSWAILSLAPLLILLTQVTVPGTSLAARSFGSPAGGPPVSLQFDPNPIRKFGDAHLDNPKAILYLHLPLLVSQIAPGTSFNRDGERFTLTNANGYTWQSPWLAKDAMLTPDGTSAPLTTFAEYFIPRDAYDRLGDGPVSVSIDFALEQFEDQLPINAAMSSEGAPVAGLGLCALDESYANIHCRTAFRVANYFDIHTSRTIGPCTDSPPNLEPASAIIGGARPPSVALHISPVVVTDLRLGFPSRSAATFRRPAILCPGTPIAFTRKLFQRRLRVEMPPTAIILKDYVGTINIR